MGTDYPFPLGDLKFGEYMEKMNSIKKRSKDFFPRFSFKLVRFGYTEIQVIGR